MKSFITLIFLYATTLDGLAQERNYEKDKNYLNDKYIEENVTEKYFKNKDDYDDDYDPGNPDNYEIIERPCAVFDRFCIRKFFAEHSNCKLVPGPVQEPYYVASNQMYLPNNNITATFNDILLTGLNGRIEEFYVNKATGSLVLSAFFDSLKGEGITTYLRFDRNGQEPVEVRALTAINYIKSAINFVFPNYKNLRLEDVEIDATLEDLLPPFVIAPESSTMIVDPTVLADVASLVADVPTAALESASTIIPVFGNIFIQKTICDFDVPISRL